MLRDPIATEELVQELFTRIWQKRESKGITENFSGYMYRIALNLVHDFFRRLKKDLVLQERFRAYLGETSDVPNAEDLLQRQQSLGLINNAIDHLPPQQKKAYKLVRQEGYSYKKAAEDMGISPITVKEYLSLANKSIRSYLFNKVGSPNEIILVAFIMLTFL
jgi:RNA polymerase sigma factor (sigma-70 family)